MKPGGAKLNKKWLWWGGSTGAAAVVIAVGITIGVQTNYITFSNDGVAIFGKPSVASFQLSKRILTDNSARQHAMQLAAVLAKKKLFQAAQKIYEGVLKSEPNNVTALNNMAYTLGEQSELDKAAQYLSKTIELSQSCAECFNNLGTIYYQQNKRNEAKQMFEKSLSVQPGYVDAMLNLAVFYEGELDWVTALQWYEKAKALIQEVDLKQVVDLRVGLIAQIQQSNESRMNGYSNKVQ